MSTEIEKLKSFPTTKNEIASFAERLNEALDSGELGALETLLRFKAIEKILEQAKPMLDKMVLNEAAKYPEKTIELFGVKFLKKNGPAQWDYTNCNDGQYKLLKQYQAEYNKKVKEREEFLQAMTEPMTALDEDTGEIVKIFPASKSQKELVQVNFQ